MTEYIPTTDVVKQFYIDGWRECDTTTESHFAEAEFNRWLIAERKKWASHGAFKERERMSNWLAADCNHAEPKCYHREIIRMLSEKELKNWAV